MTFTDLSMTFSRLACWEGVSSSSKMTRSASCDRASSAISSALPVPTKVRGLAASKRWVVVATTSAPAVSARRSSSAREDSKGHGSPGALDAHENGALAALLGLGGRTLLDDGFVFGHSMLLCLK